MRQRGRVGRSAACCAGLVAGLTGVFGGGGQRVVAEPPGAAAGTPLAARPLVAPWVARPPAVPLVVHDPYFCVWGLDRLADDWTRHWTGKTNALCLMVRIDGKAFRLAGALKDVPALPQTNLHLTATATRYTFAGAGVAVTATFWAPHLPKDLAVSLRPITYVTLEATATDGKEHAVEWYADASAEWAVNTPEQAVTWEALPPEPGGLDILKVGTVTQPVLAKTGDDRRIDWGYFHLAAPADQATVAEDTQCRRAFVGGTPLPKLEKPSRPANRQWPVMALTARGRVAVATAASWTVMAGYDDLYGLEVLGERCKSFWTTTAGSFPELLARAAAERKALWARCQRFDAELLADLSAAGGPEYAELCLLSYRQCLAAHKTVVNGKGEVLTFSKENFSNGCIGTVDLFYPAAPQFLLLEPQLLESQLRPLLDYAASSRWKFPFAPHDLGQYPKANGQVYGGGEETEKDQMPVEETGNMLILIEAQRQATGSADFSKKHRAMLHRWADYLISKGLDPENQLCTDDFAGHLAHNCNLSLKAIVALAAYAKTSEAWGDRDEARRARQHAERMAVEWEKMAKDGDHYRLAFDRPGTWSQKYNLVWDKLLGLNLFPPHVARTELDYYLRRQQQFGLPLDNRSSYTKLDWIVWTATLADDTPTFHALVRPLLKFAAETPDRVPLSDWYWTHSGKQRGFQARSVVGGVFIKVLADRATWERYARAPAGGGK